MPADPLALIDNIKVFQSGDRRAPHKPLLLLLALAALRRGERHLAFDDVREQLDPLLKAYAPPVRARHQPELPYWHLQSDGLWEVTGAEAMPRQRGGFPRMAALRASTGGLPAALAEQLVADPGLVDEATRSILDRHFPESLHDEILDAVGLDAIVAGTPAHVHAVAARRRDPDFRRKVLRAYEHRCAATGFRAALGGSYFGVEAAHVRAHCYDGPDEVGNGMVLNSTLHVLFDRGAWSLTDDRRILVSKEFTGSDEAVGMLRELHGRSLRAPLPGEEPVHPRFIRWHREPELGGVFRQPALPL